jgi:hypothetical protein
MDGRAGAFRGVGTVLVGILAWSYFAAHPSADTTYLKQEHQSQYGTGASDDTLISDARQVCGALGSSDTLQQIFDSNDFTNLNPYQRGTMIGDAVANYCPQYKATVVQQFKNQGPGGE